MSYAKITDFISLDLTSIIATLINLLILYLIFKMVLFRRINKVIEDRHRDIADSFEQADEVKRRVNALESQYNEKLASAKEESASIIRESASKAQARSERIIVEAKKEAQYIVDRARNEAEREKKRAVNSAKNEIADIALSVAESLVGKIIKSEENERVIESFIDNIGEFNE